MATTPNYSWVMPAPTDFVTDLPADFEIFGDAVDASLYALSPGTTAGDVDYYTSGTAKARLGIGTAGQVLTVNSGATAPEWATPAGGGDNFTLLNAGGTALTGATTITISGISGQNKLMILVDGASNSTTGGNSMWFTFNGDTASNYGWFGNKLSMTNTYSAGIGTSEKNFSASEIRYIGGMSTNAASTISGYLRVEGANSAGVKVWQLVGGGTASGGTDHELHFKGGVWRNAATISSLTIHSVSNFDAGTIYVYGTA